MLYGLGVSIYQGLFISGISKSISFNIPVICIGNLSVGGTGKSPHIEYLIRLLKDYVHLGVLSRGYRRATSGHKEVSIYNTALEVGDEPLQIKQKFPDVSVAVNKNRSLGIPKLLKSHPEIQTILLDDAFQHFEVKSYVNILLTEYSNPFFKDFLLPSGRLREWRFGYTRSNIIVVTKCPEEPDSVEQENWRRKLRLRHYQHLFFSYVYYGIPYNIFKTEEKFVLNDSAHVILISAIAQSSYLSNYLIPMIGTLTEFDFEDHHYFNVTELTKIIERFKSVKTYNKLILTTEKDATRLKLHADLFKNNNVSIFAIPIEIKFYNEAKFDELIKKYLLDFKS